MKILLISDIHANVDGLEAVVQKHADADRILCAGDIVHYGLFPHETIRMLKAHNVRCVCGNHDLEILRRAKEGVEAQEPGFVRYTLERLTADDLLFLETLPRTVNFTADGVRYCMRHAYHVEELTNRFLLSVLDHDAIRAFDSRWERHADAPEAKTKCFLLGHTHTPSIVHVAEDRFVYNPGTLAYRLGKDQTEYAPVSCIVIEDGVPRILHYDWDNTRTMWLRNSLDW